MLSGLRAKYQPKLPQILEDLSNIEFEKKQETTSVSDQEQIKALFPNTFGRPLISGLNGKTRVASALKVGVVLSGGQAAGGDPARAVPALQDPADG